MAVYVDELSDVLQSTQPKFERRKWVDLSHTNQRYTVVSRQFQGSKFGIEGGTKLSWRVQTSMNNSFQHIGVGAIINATPTEQLDDAEVPWAGSAVSRAWYLDEIDHNSGPEQIVEILSVNINAMYGDITVGEENCLWSTGASAAEKPRKPNGIPHYVVKGTSATAAYHLTANCPGSYTTVATLDPAVVTQWRNGAFGYADVSQSDLCPKLSEAMEKSYYEPPRSYAQLEDSKPQFVLYTTYPVWEAFQSLQTSSNDNLGTDIGRFRNTVTFKGVPMTWVPALTNAGSPVRDTQHPIYGMDWSVFKMFYKKGWDWRPMPPETPDNQPTARKVYMIARRNYKVYNRRQLFVGHTTAFAQ